LEQIAVEVSGKEPKPNQLVTLIQEAKKHNIKTVFVAPEFSQKSAKVIASSIQGKVFSISPLSLTWKENMIFAAQSIANSYND
jgi:zinc transport system substrate-binding protein